MRYCPTFKYTGCCFNLLLLVLLFSVRVTDLKAQPSSLLDRFIGSWSGKGKLMGADAEFIMAWEWILEDRFVRLTFQNKIRVSDGTNRILKAQAFYKPEQPGHFSGTWFDSRGMVLPLVAHTEHDTLTTHWGTPETEEGRTVYRLLDQNRIEVEDFVLKDDEWHRFGYAVYHRPVED